MFKRAGDFLSRVRDDFFHSLMELRPLESFLFGVFGFLLGLSILLSTNPAYLHPTEGPKLSIFLVMITLLIETYFVAVPLSVRSSRNVTAIARRYDPGAKLFARRSNARFWFLLFFFCALDLAPFLWLAIALPGDPQKFPNGPTVTLFVTSIGAAAAFFVLCSVWQVDSATRVVFPDKVAVAAFRAAGGDAEVDERSKRLIDDYLAIRGELFQSLTILGLMVSLFTLSVGAFRYCNQDYDKVLYQKFHAEFVILLGVYYSGLLALVLVPPYLRLVESGRVLRDVLLQPSAGATQTVAEFLGLRKTLEESLTLNVGLTDTFRHSFLVLGPLISGVVPLLIGLGAPDSKAESKKDEAGKAEASAPESPTPSRKATPPPTKPAPSAKPSPPGEKRADGDASPARGKG